MANEPMAEQFLYRAEHLRILFDKIPALAVRLLDVSYVVIKLNLYPDFFCHPVLQLQQFDDVLKGKEHVAQKGYPFYLSFPIKGKSGQEMGVFYVLDARERTFSDEENSSLHDLILIVTNQVELELESKRVIEKHQQLLSTTAHDLKNPLTTIPVRADLIKLKKHEPETVERMCDQIKIASLNMIRIIDELLQSGLAEDGKIQLLLVKLNASVLVGNVVSMNQLLAERKHQVINMKLGCEAMVRADEGKLSEIIDNLLNNAIKYSPLEALITVEVEVIGEEVLISVQDEGPGLTAEDQLVLYQRFTRLSAQPTAGENSTGLGLYIVKALVEAHEGKIHVESEGKGAKFTVVLPLCN